MLDASTGALRVEVTGTPTGRSFDVQLNYPRLPIVRGAQYSIGFRARADQPRRIGVGCAQAHEPWENLGLFIDVDLTTEWQRVESTFIAARDDANARLHFDLGQATIPVEISDVRIVSQDTGARVQQTREPAGRVGKPHGPCALILMYHRIAENGVDPWSLSVSAGRFAEQLGVLREHARPIRLGELGDALARGAIPHRGVVVTFDDGYADNYSAAKPLLEKFSVPATVFVATGNIGTDREFWWDELERLLLSPGRVPGSLHVTVNGTERRWDLGDAAEYRDEEWRRDRAWTATDAPPTLRHAVYLELWRVLQPLDETQRAPVLRALRDWAGTAAPRAPRRTMTRAELQSLTAGGLIEVGAHTVTHPALPSLPIERQRQEVEQSQHTLREVLGASIQRFAYPYGASTPDTLNVLRGAGFTTACSTASAVVTKDSDPLQLPRVTAQNWSGAEFRRLVADWLS